jgi:hypothetical protein
MTMLSTIIKTSKFALATLCLMAALALTSAAQGFRVTGVTLTASPHPKAARCPVTLNFSGTITANGPGVVKYTFVRNDGGMAPAFTMEFDAAGTKPLGTTWTLDLPAYEGWQAVKILSPNEMFSEKATFRLECEKKPAAGGATHAPGPTPVSLQAVTSQPCYSMPMPMAPPICPDLAVAMKGTPVATDAGVDVGNTLRLIGRNLPTPPGETRRRAAAAGTRGGAARGYMIDLVLSSDAKVANGPATFSATFAEDALLRGGRVSNTLDLAAGEEKAHRVGAVIPADTPPGRYFLCARIDPMNEVAETDENNNVTCVAIKVRDKNPKHELNKSVLKMSRP